jgi:hypothetical protein
MRQFSFPEAGTISAAQAFVQGARGSIGGAYRPFRSSLLIFLYFKAEAAIFRAIEKVNQKAPAADGNAWG